MNKMIHYYSIIPLFYNNFTLNTNNLKTMRTDRMITIIFTDLDGTLLDSSTYSYEKAKDALRLVKKFQIPLVFCTSKTRSEIEYWRKKIGNIDPFISENGGGIFVPKNYFSFPFSYNTENRNYFVMEIGKKYDELVSNLNNLKKKYEIIDFSDMSAKEIAKDANLEISQAKLAKTREFDLPFKIINKDQESNILHEIKKQGLKYTVGGRYYHLIGDNNKGKAVKILLNLFRHQYGDIKAIAIGDSENDFEMLDAVDIGFLVKKKNGSYATNRYKKAKGIGPEGWNTIVIRRFTHD